MTDFRIKNHSVRLLYVERFGRFRILASQLIEYVHNNWMTDFRIFTPLKPFIGIKH